MRSTLIASRPSLVALALLLVTLGCLSGGYAVQKPKTTSKPKVANQDYWLGIYSSQTKLGYMHVVVKRDKLEGKSVYRRDMTMVVCICLLGEKRRDEFTHTVYADDQLVPIRDIGSGKSSGGSTGGYDLRLGPKSQRYTVTTDGKSTVQTAAYDKGELQRRIAGCRFLFGVTTSAMGKQTEINRGYLYVDYGGGVGFSNKRVRLEVLRKENQLLDGKPVSTYVVVEKSDSLDSTSWLTADGAIMKEERGRDGVTFVREPRKKATEIESSGYEWPEVSGVRSDIPIEASRLKELKVRLVGLTDEKFIYNDWEQKAVLDKAKGCVDYTITGSSFDGSKALALPMSSARFLSDYLAESEGIPVNDKRIQALASEIAGKETNSVAVSGRIVGWLSANIRFDEQSDIPCNALDVLNAKCGCCRHIAVLYTALARAAGIPTRMVAGLMYSPEHGMFGKHAWVESYFGEWLGGDPSSSRWTDASYIKMAVGNDNSVLETVLRSAGMKAEIISYKKAE